MVKAGAQDSHVWRGRCNFTNLYVEPAAYLSQNPILQSALARYNAVGFYRPVGKHGIAGTKTLGQLFCDDSAQQIVDMLVDECEKVT